MRKRGNPGRTASTLQVDERIGRTIYRLSMWGFPLPACRTAAAKAAIQRPYVRSGLDGRVLGDDSVKKIYDLWKIAARKRGELVLGRDRVTKSYLASRRPRGTIDALARKLMAGWTGPPVPVDGMVYPPPEYSLKAIEEFAEFPIVFARTNRVKK